MRAAAVLLLLASVASADRIMELTPPRRGPPAVMVLPPATQRRQPPAIDQIDLQELRNRAAVALGLERVAALDALTAGLEVMFDVADDGGSFLTELDTHYGALLNERDLEAYRHADELMFRAANHVGNHEPLAVKAAERLIAKFPKSPFVTDARLLLAKHHEARTQYAIARRHLDTVIAKEARADFVRYARLRRGWVKSLAGDHQGAVAELRALATDPMASLLAVPAIDQIAWSYAHVGRVDQAALLFDSVDRRKAPAWLRGLAHDYGVIGKRGEQVAALRAAIARDADANEACVDRAEIVVALVRGKASRVAIRLAIAELEEAVALADATCTRPAERALHLARSMRPAPGG